MTCDRLKQSVTGKKFYDLVAHYITVSKLNLIYGRLHVVMPLSVLLLEEKIGQESAAALRNLLEVAWLQKFGLHFEKFMSRYTFVTDHASTLPCFIGSSSSSSKVPFTHKWLGCVSHLLNTVMKHCVQEQQREDSIERKVLIRVKTIVRVFKHGNWNVLLPQGYSVIQEVETRFGTTHVVVESFLKSVDKVSDIIASKDSTAARDAFRGTIR